MLEIQPFTSVGELVFGTDRTSIRKTLDYDHDPFNKTANGNLVDAYDNLGIHLHYDDADKLEFVEMFEPAEVVYGGVALLAAPFSKIKAEFARMGIMGEATDVGYLFLAIGVAFVLEDGGIDSVSASRAGYFDSHY